LVLLAIGLLLSISLVVGIVRLPHGADGTAIGVLLVALMVVAMPIALLGGVLAYLFRWRRTN